MGTIIIKPERGEDFYVGWSGIVEAPVWWGTRDEVTRYLVEDRRLRGNVDDLPEVRLARADQYGTSDMSVREGAWADEGLIYEQRGILPRRHLAEMCQRLAENDEPGVWDLLEPFEDETEVRRG